MVYFEERPKMAMKNLQAPPDVPTPWAHGPARLESDRVVMQVDAYGAKDSLHITQAIDVELSRIHTPADAVTFVRRFGLLEQGVYFPESIYMPGSYITADDQIPLEASEPYAIFQETAA